MKAQSLLIATTLLAVYGCQPQAPEQKAPAPAPAAVVAAPPAAATPAEPAAQPVAGKDAVAAPVKQADPAPAAAAGDKAAAPAPKEKPVTVVKEHASAAAVAPKPEKKAPVASAPAAPVAAEAPAAKPEKIDTAKLNKIDRKLGDGTLAVTGKQVSVHYTGWLYDEAKPDHRGAKFDSSRDRGQAFEFGLGAGMVIPGWEQGVEGMKVGGQRTLIIPPALGYGSSGAGRVIPPNAILVFDIELLGVR